MDAVETKSTFSQQYGWSIGEPNKKCKDHSFRLFLLKTHGTSLKDESLHTFLIEVEAIVNSWLFAIDLLGDVDSMIPLSPINLLKLKPKVMPPSPFLRVFAAPHICCCEYWRILQKISNEFCSGWRTEVLAIFQCWQKQDILEETVKWEILSYSRKQQQNEIVV